MAYLSLANAKVALGIASADTSDDTLLADLILEAQNAIDLDCGGRSFEAATRTLYYGADVVHGQDLLLDADLLAVTTLTNGDGTVLTGGDYTLWPRNSTPYARIRLKSTVLWQFSQDGEISVSGSWGYATTAPAAVARACKEYVHFLYHDLDARRERKIGAAKAGVLPEHITRLLVTLRRPI
jgi:hypothetical protein